jgi:hypothetical protein
MNDIISEKHWSKEIPAVGDRFVPRDSRESYVASLRVVYVAEGYVMYEATAARESHIFMDVMKINVFNNAYKKQLFDRAQYVNLYDGWHYDSLESANLADEEYINGNRIGVLYLLPDGTTGFLPENEALRG